MTPERWQQIDQLFAAALDWEPTQRSKLLREASAGDEELRLEVESLLSAHDEANSKIDAPGAADGLRLLVSSNRRESSPATVRPDVSVAGQSPTHPGSHGASTPPLPYGSTLDRYLVLKPLGGGGMGIVFSAYDPQLDRKIALKLLRPDTFGKTRASEGRARLLREAQAMARLSHPNVIAVFDVGTFNDQVFIAMEYIDGRTLTRWLKEAQRSWRAVLDVFVEAGRGLAAAHASGLIHRDFKPDNVLIGNDGRVRVLDFGLARATEGEGGESTIGRNDTLRDLPLSSRDSPLESRLTHPGFLLGTPAYMAPEQLTGSSIDARTDQFAFCVALHEGLYGESPFEKTPGLTADRRLKEPPKSTRIPRALREVLLRGLKPRREDRFASMRELLIALEAAARRPTKRAAVALILLIGAAAIAGVTWTLRSRPQSAVEPPRFHRITDSGRDYSPAASLDGRSVVFTSERDGSPRVWLKRLPGGQELALTVGPDQRPRLSPDGSLVMFVRDDGARSALYISPVAGGEPRKTVEDASDGDFAPDGRQVVFIRLDPQTGAGRTIEIASANGSNAREIFSLRAGAGSLDGPRWSPNGSTIAVRQAAASTGIPDSILLIQTNGAGSRLITPPGLPGRISALAFSESGSALVYGQSESLTSTRANVSTRMIRLNVATLEADTLFWVPERV